jgi:hypothetical protein
MRLPSLLCLCLLLAVPTLRAESKKASDYPLRIHVYGRNETTFYYGRVEEEAKGEGRANLFENSVAHGVDFSFDCSEKLKASFGYSTYPAKWKKPGRELVVLIPVFGESNTYSTCSLKTDVKDFVYARHDGKLRSESVDKYHAWMLKHDYDPEHGKEAPVNVAASEAEPSGPAESAVPPTP